jgi:sucrose-6-phosphate hydrolase SacC (GH32 family)
MRRRIHAKLIFILALAACGSIAPLGDDPWPDDLTHWQQNSPQPVFTGTGDGQWDQKIRERGWILVDGETWHLWYTGYNLDRSPLRMLGHATSPDGIHWTRDPRNPIHSTSWVEDVCVVKDGDLFVMFAEGAGDIAHQLESRDGVHWTDLGRLDIRQHDGSPLSDGPRGTPAVWLEDGVWNLFYERGDTYVRLARSKDRRVWTNVQADPVLYRGPEAYDASAIALNQVIKRKGWYYGVYHANSHLGKADWTTCLARSRDLIHWEKYPGNPIVENNASSGLFVDPDGDGPLPTRLYTMHPDVRVYEAKP